MTTEASLLLHALGFALVDFLWQGTAIAMVCAVVLRLGQKWSADVRYVIACLGLVAMASAPVVTLLRELLVNAPLLAAAPVTTPAAQADGVDVAVFDSAIGTSWLAAWRAHLEPWLPWLVGLWTAGVAWLSFGLLRAWRGLSRVRRSATRRLPLVLATALAHVREALPFRRPVDVALSTMVDSPTVLGWLRPVLLMPVSLTSGLSLAELESILAHELAHLRRFDHVVNGLQVALETLLFYHPAVWWLSRQVRLERELCCDDAAIAVVEDRVIYASALASLAEYREQQHSLSVAANGGDLLARVQRILGGPMNTRQHAFSLPWAVSLLGLAALTTVALAAAPRPGVPDGGVPAASPTVRATQSSGAVTDTTTFLQTQVAVLDLQFRQAVQVGDRSRLASLLADAFVGTDQNGVVDTRASFLSRTNGGSRFERHSQSVQVDGDSAIVTGIESEIRGTTRERMLFTRVWRRVASGYQLISSTQFRDPRPAAIPGMASAPGTPQPGRQPTPARTPEPVPAGGTLQPYSGQPTPAPMPLPANTLRVGGDIREPKKLVTVPPVYPAIAKAAGVSGVVILEVLVDESGSVGNIRVLRGIPMLDPAAVDAVSQWKYVPTMVNGTPVPLVMTVTVNFYLPKPAEQP